MSLRVTVPTRGNGRRIEWKPSSTRAAVSAGPGVRLEAFLSALKTVTKRHIFIPLSHLTELLTRNNRLADPRTLFEELYPDRSYTLGSLLDHVGTHTGYQIIEAGSGTHTALFLTRPFTEYEKSFPSFRQKVHALVPRFTGSFTVRELYDLFVAAWPQDAKGLSLFEYSMNARHSECCSKVDGFKFRVGVPAPRWEPEDDLVHGRKRSFDESIGDSDEEFYDEDEYDDEDGFEEQDGESRPSKKSNSDSSSGDVQYLGSNRPLSFVPKPSQIFASAIHALSPNRSRVSKPENEIHWAPTPVSSSPIIPKASNSFSIADTQISSSVPHAYKPLSYFNECRPTAASFFSPTYDDSASEDGRAGRDASKKKGDSGRDLKESNGSKQNEGKANMGSKYPMRWARLVDEEDDGMDSDFERYYAVLVANDKSRDF